MRWKEILIGAGIYLLVILSGYEVPFFIHLVKAHCQTLIAFGKEERAVWRFAVHSFGL